MNKKQLVELGIAEDIADKIIVLHGKDIEKHKGDVTTLEKQVETLQGQLTEAGETIEGFKKMDIESIKKAADDYKRAAADAEKKAADDIKSLKFAHAIESKLRDEKAKNVKAARALLDLDGLKYNEKDDSIVGLDEQLTKIKKDAAYLFETSDSDADSNDDVQVVTGVKPKTPKPDEKTLAQEIGERLKIPKG